MAGGTGMVLTPILGTEDFWGHFIVQTFIGSIASAAYPTNGYSVDPATVGQLNRFKVIDNADIAGGTNASGISWGYDYINKSIRGYQNAAGAGALAELSSTFPSSGTALLKITFYGR